MMDRNMVDLEQQTSRLSPLRATQKQGSFDCFQFPQSSLATCSIPSNSCARDTRQTDSIKHSQTFATREPSPFTSFCLSRNRWHALVSTGNSRTAHIWSRKMASLFCNNSFCKGLNLQPLGLGSNPWLVVLDGTSFSASDIRTGGSLFASDSPCRCQRRTGRNWWKTLPTMAATQWWPPSRLPRSLLRHLHRHRQRQQPGADRSKFTCVLDRFTCLRHMRPTPHTCCCLLRDCTPFRNARRKALLWYCDCFSFLSGRILTYQ